MLRCIVLGVFFLPAAAATEPPATRTDGLGDPLPDGIVARLGTTRLRPGGSVVRLAFSPDGSKLASWGGDVYVNKSLIIWDTRTGRALRRVDLPGSYIDVVKLAWLADGRGFALVRPRSDKPTTFVWEFTDEKAEAPPAGPGGQGGIRIVPANQPMPDDERDSCYAISPDGTTLAIGRAGREERGREVRLCRLRGGVMVDELAALKVVGTHPANCNHLFFTPDGRTLVVASRPLPTPDHKPTGEQLVSVWDVAAAKERTRFATPWPAVNGSAVGLAVSDRLLAIGLESGDASVWDLGTGREQKIAAGHVAVKRGGRGAHGVAFTPDGKSLVTGGRDGVVKLWDVETGRLLRKMERHDSWVEVVATSGTTIVSAGQDGAIRLWVTATGADACPLPGHRYAIWKAALSADGTTAITVGGDETLRWWDATTGVERRTVVVPEGIEDIIHSPNGKTLLVTTVDGRLRTWDSATGRETALPELPAEAKFSKLSFTPDGRHLVAASGPKVSIWDWSGLKPVREIELLPPAQPGETQCLVAAVSPDGRWLVTVAHGIRVREEDGLKFGFAGGGVVDLWDFATGKRIRRLAESRTVYRCGTFAVDGRFAVVGGGGGTVPAEGGGTPETFKGEVNLLDTVARRPVWTFEVPPAAPGVSHRYVGATALSPDGRTLYVSFNTGEVVAFETATGKPRRTFSDHAGYVGTLAVSANGRRMLSGAHDGVGLVRDLTLRGSAALPKGPIDPEALWESAASGEPRDAFAAMVALASAPDRAVAVLQQRIQPAPPGPTAAELDKIFRDLESNDFTVREKASKTLEAHGESAVTAVRDRLAGIASPEVRARAAGFLAAFDRPTPSAVRVRQIRAVELLEGLETAEAKAFLTDLAAGGASHPQSQDAAAALKRLARP